MKKEYMRQKLMESAIHVVATEGIHKATTKAIANHSGVNEVYIYRLFEDKDDLFLQTFALIDSELIACILKYEPIMNMQGIEIEERCYIFFKSCWRNILDYDKCSFFIKYYYSHYYNSYSPLKRRKAYSKVIESFTPAFKKGTDVWRIFNRILDIVYSTIIKILRGEIPDNDETAEDVFRVLYSALEPFLVWSKSKTTKTVLENQKEESDIVQDLSNISDTNKERDS